MYESPSIHLELAKQRQQLLLADAKHSRVPKHQGGDVDGSQRLLAVKSVFAGIIAAISGAAKAETAQKPAATPC